MDYSLQQKKKVCWGSASWVSILILMDYSLQRWGWSCCTLTIISFNPYSNGLFITTNTNTKYYHQYLGFNPYSNGLFITTRKFICQIYYFINVSILILMDYSLQHRGISAYRRICYYVSILILMDYSLQHSITVKVISYTTAFQSLF